MALSLCGASVDLVSTAVVMSSPSENSVIAPYTVYVTTCECACVAMDRSGTGLNGVSDGAVVSHWDHLQVAGFVAGFCDIEQVFV